jgi:tetratricopeptide (TPR) repeat protein
VALVAFGWSLTGPFHLADAAILSARAVTEFSGPLRYPQSHALTWLTFWVNYQFGGANPIGWHVVNLLLHLASVLLVFSALRRLILERAALLAAALFAVHPLNAEAVNYVHARGALLCTVLTLASLRSWLTGRRWPVVAWFAGALVSGNQCLTFPLFVIMLNFGPSRERRDWKPLATMLGLSLVATLEIVYASAPVSVSRLAYLAAEGPVLLRYLRLLLIPAGLTVDPDVRLIAGWPAVLSWLVVLALAASARRLYSGFRAGLWFIAGLLLLLPSASIFPAGDLAADSRMYLPMIAFAAAGAMLMHTMRTAALVVVCASLAAISISRCEVWRTDVSLWSEAVRLSPEKLQPRIRLARALPPVRALSVLAEAEEIAPGDPALLSEQGRVYLRIGDAAQALELFDRELAANPANPLALSDHGAALLELGKPDAARRDFEQALVIDPCQPAALHGLHRMGTGKPAPQGCENRDLTLP